MWEAGRLQWDLTTSLRRVSDGVLAWLENGIGGHFWILYEYRRCGKGELLTIAPGAAQLDSFCSV
jgi:hypothetical protein